MRGTARRSDLPQWVCGDYPIGPSGYGSGTLLSFSAEDDAGNPISGTLYWGNAHDAPKCTPGMQVFQGVVEPKDQGEGALGGQWSYLGQTYSTTPGSTPLTACLNPYCYIAVSVDQTGDIDITLGYDGSNGLSYLNLAGYAVITSSSFGQSPVYSGQTYLGEFAYSDGTFTVSPEPATLALFLLVGLGVFAYRTGRALV